MSQSENATPVQRAGLRAVLTHDHARLEQLFAQLRAAFDADAREDTVRLWGELERGLAAHMDFEERKLLPAFAAVDRPEADGLLREHDLIRRRLIELGVGLDLHLLRAEVVADFIALLRGHAQREDALLYHWAEREIPPATQSLFPAAPRAGKAAPVTPASRSGV